MNFFTMGFNSQMLLIFMLVYMLWDRSFNFNRSLTLFCVFWFGFSGGNVKDQKVSIIRILTNLLYQNESRLILKSWSSVIWNYYPSLSLLMLVSALFCFCLAVQVSCFLINHTSQRLEDQRVWKHLWVF